MDDLFQELHRSEPFSGLAEELVLSLARSGDQLDNQLARFFRAHDLTHSQFSVLVILDMENRPLTCGEIGGRLVQVVPAVTSLVDRLLKRDLVTRRRSEEDRRTVYVTLTKQGRKLVRPIRDRLRDLEIEITSGLKQKEKRELIRLLQIVRHSMNQVSEWSANQSLQSFQR